MLPLMAGDWKLSVVPGFIGPVFVTVSGGLAVTGSI